MHEILTLQFGHRANHIATHFWNTQESYFTYDSAQSASPIDHDVHFRPGIGAKGEETFTPRTLIYDLKGGFGGLRKRGGLYDQQQLDNGHGAGGCPGLWDGNVSLQAEPQITRSDYQQSLDEGHPDAQKLSTQTVHYWSDFNRVFYHPRSIVQINDYELTSSLMPFKHWENGEELFLGMDREHDLLDRDVRLWVEECDQMQGMQIYTGADDAWGGFASKYSENLRDEFGKMAIWAWGIEDESGKGEREQQLVRSINAARTIHEMSRHTSMYIPLALPADKLPKYVNLDRNSPWHSSALLVTALESITLPTRIRADSYGRGLLGDIEAALNTNGNQRIAEMQCSIEKVQVDLPHSLISREQRDGRVPSTTKRSGTMDGDTEVDVGLDIALSGVSGGVLSSVTRGQERYHVFGAVEQLRGQAVTASDEKIDDNEVNYAKKRRKFAGLPIVERYQSPLEFPLLDSFPSIFDMGQEVSGIAVHSSLSTSAKMSTWTRGLQRIAGQMASLDEREVLVNGLAGIGEAYEEGWHGDSEDEDED